jgi:hypothetical protein
MKTLHRKLRSSCIRPLTFTHYARTIDTRLQLSAAKHQRRRAAKHRIARSNCTSPLNFPDSADYIVGTVIEIICHDFSRDKLHFISRQLTIETRPRLQPLTFRCSPSADGSSRPPGRKPAVGTTLTNNVYRVIIDNLQNLAPRLS